MSKIENDAVLAKMKELNHAFVEAFHEVSNREPPMFAGFRAVEKTYEERRWNTLEDLSGFNHILGGACIERDVYGAAADIRTPLASLKDIFNAKASALEQKQAGPLTFLRKDDKVRAEKYRAYEKKVEDILKLI